MSLTQKNCSPNLNKTTIDGGKNKVKKRKQLTSTPIKKRAKSQPPLLEFLISNEVPTVIKNPSNSLTNGLMPDSGAGNHIFLFMLGTKIEMEYVQPILIKTFDSVLNPKEFMRFRIDNSSYVGRIISHLKNLKALEASVDSVVSKYSIGWKANIIKKEFMILACTKTVQLMEIPLSDERVIFLKTIIQSSEPAIKHQNSSTQGNSSKTCANNENFFDNVEVNESLLEPIDDPDESQPNSVNSEIHNDEFNEAESNHDSGHCFDISSASDDELESNQQEKKRRRKRGYTDSKLIAQFREEKRKQANEANVEIVSLINTLNECIPTLPVDNQLTPVIKKIYKFCQALNSKFNNLNEKAVLENVIPITRTIKLQKSTKTDQINLIGIMKFPIKEYTWALQADEPRLVMSRIMRGCIPDAFKIDCTVNDQMDNSNFLYRIGDETLEGQQRLDNGKEKIELLIEHSHTVKKLERMTFNSYRDCKAQVDRALYDFARNKQKRIGIPQSMENDRKNENKLAEQDEVKYY